MYKDGIKDGVIKRLLMNSCPIYSIRGWQPDVLIGFIPMDGGTQISGMRAKY